MTPSAAFLAMGKALFAKAWREQGERVAEIARTASLKVREIEADIDKTVDRMLEVSNPRALRAFEDRIETLEREKLIALEQAKEKPIPARPFAEMFELSMRFLANPYECWKIGTEHARALVPKLAFAAPLQYTRETGCLNSKKPSVFSMLEGLTMSGKEMVPPGRLELPLP
jgi:site-specific DNA recombinase